MNKFQRFVLNLIGLEKEWNEREFALRAKTRALYALQGEYAEFIEDTQAVMDAMKANRIREEEILRQHGILPAQPKDH